MTYSITAADLERDKEAILRIWKGNFPDVPEQRYSWMYENNPYGRAVCWLAKDTRQETVVGVTSLFPRRILIRGKCRTAGIAGDFAVDKEYRAFGPALALQKTAVSSCCQKGFNLLYGFPNKQAELMHQRAGYRFLGNLVRMTKPIRSQYYLKRYLKSETVARLLSKPVDFAMRLRSKENYYRRPETLSVEIVSTFDSRFDELWARASSQYALIGERESGYLNWRYTCSPHRKYSTFGLMGKRDGTLIGYIVFYSTANKVHIADLLALDLEDAFDSLLSEFLLFLRKEAIESVSILYLGSEVLRRRLEEYGFSMRDTEAKIIVYADPDFPLLADVSNKDNWYLLEGDKDL